jgi:hypothetical protein
VSRPELALRLALAATTVWAAPLAAQQRIVVQGLAGVEAWSTDDGSRLLARNDGRTALLGQLHLWGAAAIRPDLLLLALGSAEGGAATQSGEVKVRLDQLVLRWTLARELALEVGRFPSPLGAFAPRRLPDANPLIGVPDLYPVAYPWGGMLSGAIGPLDYRAAVVDRPANNEKYVPAGGSRPRLALGAGVTPVIGVRLGASFTSGSYLSGEIDSLLAPGDRWQDFGQRVLAFDARASRGYLELRAEAALSSYDVPGIAEPVTGKALYLEAKYTWAPRFFTALRLERNRYAFVRPRAGGSWMGLATTFDDIEVAAGYRLSPRTLVKASFRTDFWDVPATMRSILPNGHAIAMQLSHGFDLTSWLDRPD